MAIIGEILFYRRDGVDLDAVLRYQGERGLREVVDHIPEALFSAKSDDELAAEIARDRAFSPLRVEFDKARASVQETHFEVQDIFNDRATVKGLRAMKEIPFSGNRDLWELRPNPFDINAPYGSVSGQTLTIGIEVRENQADDAVQYFDQTIQKIKQNLERQEKQIAAFNASLAQRAIPFIQVRRSTLDKAADLLNRLK